MLEKHTGNLLDDRCDDVPPKPRKRSTSVVINREVFPDHPGREVFYGSEYKQHQEDLQIEVIPQSSRYNSLETCTPSLN